MPNPRYRVPGPTFTPAPFGLLSVAQVVDESDPHWRNGIEWESTCFPAASATVAPCTEVLDTDEEAEPGDLVEATIPAKSIERGVGMEDGPAVTLYGGHACSAIGRTTEADRDRAGMALTNGEGRGLELVVQTGQTEAGVLPYRLADAPSLVMATPGSTVAAFGALEAGIAAEYGGVGVIHAPRPVVVAAIAANIVIRSANGARLETVLGTPVAAYTAWDFTAAPSDVPGIGEGILAIYGTSPVVIYRGGVTTYDDVDRAVNDRLVIAERTYAYGWSCVTQFALIDTTTL